MSDAPASTPGSADKPATDPTAPGQGPDAKPPEEWKPEPRQWTWKDVFTAPMLAFKPKCMLVMAVVAVLIGLWFKVPVDSWEFAQKPWLAPVIHFVQAAVALIIFSLGATLVAVFMKADLLDDEFLTFGEALTQYKSRLVPAILVPLFLLGAYGGFQLLIALGSLVCAIPGGVGATIYAIFYPVAFLLGLFVVLLGIAVGLSIFVFPSIIAIRRHGWFDNVVDTFEAVGTKPHVLVGSGLIVGVLIWISAAIASGAMGQLTATSVALPGDQRKLTEVRSTQVQNDALTWTTQALIGTVTGLVTQPRTSYSYGDDVWRPAPLSVTGYPKITGTVTGIWKTLIGALVIGYCLNLFIGGGMLTYLVVREDDYWDDEDLEDLDKLAKELEDEAKQEAVKAGGDAAAAPEPAAPAEPPKAT